MLDIQYDPDGIDRGDIRCGRDERTNGDHRGRPRRRVEVSSSRSCQRTGRVGQATHGSRSIRKTLAALTARGVPTSPQARRGVDPAPPRRRRGCSRRRRRGWRHLRRRSTASARRCSSTSSSRRSRSPITGQRVLLMHASNEGATMFYERFGFKHSPVDDLTLMLWLQDGEARTT